MASSHFFVFEIINELVARSVEAGEERRMKKMLAPFASAYAKSVITVVNDLKNMDPDFKKDQIYSKRDPELQPIDPDIRGG